MHGKAKLTVVRDAEKNLPLALVRDPEPMRPTSSHLDHVREVYLNSYTYICMVQVQQLNSTRIQERVLMHIHTKFLLVISILKLAMETGNTHK